MAGLPNLFGRSATFVDPGQGSSAQEDDVQTLNGDFHNLTLESGVKSQSFNKEKIGDERSATIVRGEGSSAQEDDVQKSKFEPHLRSMILAPGLEDKVQKLRSRFSAVQAALSDAESRYVTEKTEQDWLEKLRDISYEIDDVLDVWDTALLKIRIIDEEKNAQNIGSSYYNNPSPCSWLEQLAQDNNLPTRIDELDEKFGVIAREKDIYRFKSETLVAVVPQHQKSAVPHREESTSFIDASRVFGRDPEIELITSELGRSRFQESGLDIISIVGMGGMGKTTIAQRIYNDVETKFEKTIWVCVSDPFDGLRVAKSIVEELDGPAQNYTTLQSSLKYINGSIRGKKFMLVLDDVWTEDCKVWEPFSIALRNGARGSKILVTTRNAKVAKMMGSSYTHPLGKLSEDYSWELFRRVAFLNKDEAERENLKELGQIVVERCEGLPLALKVIGSHLRLKTTEREWRNVVNNELWKLPVVEAEIFRPLLLSYYDLTSPIKRCFSYCAIYPKDELIKPEELIRLWMSQGYLDSTGREDKEAVGQEYFGELVLRSFFQDFRYGKDDGSITACKMHDIVHDFCQSLAKNECITSDSTMRNDPGMSSSTSKKFYHLGMSDFRTSEDVISNLGVQNLRTLLLGTSWRFDGGVEFPYLSRQLKFLKALDLSWCGLRELPDELGQFVHLRYLNLSGNYELKRLPETIYGMCNLQTLLLDGCEELRKLPQGIEKLINLRHLQVEWETVVLPKGIGRICSLRTLSEFLVCRSEDSAGASIEDLGKLNNLQGCFRISQLKNVVDEREAMKARLMDKIEVTHLLLDFKDGEGIKDEDGVVEGLQPHRSLKGLAIRYYSGKLLPSWITSLSKLRALVLEFCDRCDGLPPLGKLSSLEHLIVRGMDNLTRIGEAFLGITTVDIKLANATNSPVVAFPKLTDLYFSGMEKWEEWEGKLKAKEMEGNKDAKFEIFPRLRYLEIQGCGRLKALPQYIQMAPIEEFRIARSPIVELSWITSLSKLRTLFLKSCDRCDGLPPLGKLSSLEHLVVKGMANLTRIGEDFLGITTVDIKLANATNSPVVAFPKLTRLTFKRMEKWEEWEGKLIAKEMEGNKDAKFKIFPRLRFLQIFECPELKALPQYIQMAPIEELYTRQSPIVELNWITSLSKLSTLKLDSCDRCDGLPPLGKLSSLEHLTVRGMDNLTRIGEDFLGITTVDIKLANATNSPVVAFPKLTYLKFKRMRNWERWEGKLIAKEMEGNKDAKFEIFPRLRYLRIVDCPRLKALPQYIQMAPIEELRIAWSPTIEKRCKRNSGEDWHKISHIPTVRIWDWNTGRWIEK